jgi:hypothetical protein
MEDENLARFLTNYVQDNGGAAFFDRPGWRRSLRGLALDCERRNGTRARFQTCEERYADMYNDFLQSKRMIEEKIGNRVTHFCYPWFLGCELAVRASREAGYESNYWGLLKRRTISRIGDDPYHVARLIEDYIFLLPGKNRRNLCRVLADRCRRIAARGKGQNPLAGGLN